MALLLVASPTHKAALQTCMFCSHTSPRLCLCAPFPPSTHTGYAYICNVAVSPSAQRSGVATRLMAEAEALAAAWGCSKAGLHVNMTNTPALGLYRCVWCAVQLWGKG